MGVPSRGPFPGSAVCVHSLVPPDNPRGEGLGRTLGFLGLGSVKRRASFCLRETGWSPAPPGWPGCLLLTTITPGLSKVPALVSLQRVSESFLNVGYIGTITQSHPKNLKLNGLSLVKEYEVWLGGAGEGRRV